MDGSCYYLEIEFLEREEEMSTSERAYAVQLIWMLVVLPGFSGLSWADTAISGHITDPQGQAVAGAAVGLRRPNGAVAAEAQSDDIGQYAFRNIGAGVYRLSASGVGFAAVEKDVSVAENEATQVDLQFEKIAAQSESVGITAKVVEPAVDLRNGEAFNRTLFTRDDQVFQQLNAGINVGQHEGGGKSLEIRRFGFNLDHGGVNGGLKVMLDDVQQNQGSQGHGQGYLGSLKALSPELIQDVTIINGPFSPEYGDFSGL
jgi:hypothetical protein